MFAGHGVDALHGRQDTQLLTAGTHAERLFLHVALRLQHEAGNLEVREAEHFGLAEHIGRHIGQSVVAAKHLLIVNNVLQSFEEPRSNLGQLVEAIDGVTLFECLSQCKDAQVGGVGKLVVEVVKLGVFVAHESVHTLANHAEALLDNLFERTADGHDFAHRLHA